MGRDTLILATGANPATCRTWRTGNVISPYFHSINLLIKQYSGGIGAPMKILAER